MRISLIITFTCLRSSARRIFKSWGSADVGVCLSVRSAGGRCEFTGNYRKKKMGKKETRSTFISSRLSDETIGISSAFLAFLPSSAGGRREEELVGLARQATCLRNTFPLLVLKTQAAAARPCPVPFKLQKTSRTVRERARATESASVNEQPLSANVGGRLLCRVSQSLPELRLPERTLGN